MVIWCHGSGRNSSCDGTGRFPLGDCYGATELYGDGESSAGDMSTPEQILMEQDVCVVCHVRRGDRVTDDLRVVEEEVLIVEADGTIHHEDCVMR